LLSDIKKNLPDAPEESNIVLAIWDYILIPPMTKAELEDLAGKLRGKGRSV
jgi:hypothetical protein